MNALHVLWTAPYQARGVDVEAVDIMPWFERVFLAASALLWRFHSGDVTLMTDRAGGASVERWGLTHCWSAVDVETLQRAPAEVDPAVFWDFGKTLALANIRLPVVLLDLDLIAWQPLRPRRPTHFYHYEDIEPPWYPPPEDLSRPLGYCFPAVDWSIRPANTALLYLASEDYRDRFVSESMRYAVDNVVPEKDGLAAFLFSGQRLFSLVGGGDDMIVSPYLPFVYSVKHSSRWLNGRIASTNPLRPDGFQHGQPVTHLWSYKHTLRNSDTELEIYCISFIRHLLKRYPLVGANLLPIIDHNTPEGWKLRLGPIIERS